MPLPTRVGGSVPEEGDWVPLPSSVGGSVLNELGLGD